jgi:hypothetical protein
MTPRATRTSSGVACNGFMVPRIAAPNMRRQHWQAGRIDGGDGLCANSRELRTSPALRLSSRSHCLDVRGQQ